MKVLFGWITRLSLRFRVITIALAVLVAVLGVIGITHLRQELIPPIEVPQTVILSQVSGMTSDEVLVVLTQRLEEALAQVPDVANLESAEFRDSADSPAAADLSGPSHPSSEHQMR